VLLQQVAVGDRPKTTRVTGVGVGKLLLALVAGEGDLAGVDDDDEVTSVDVRREGGLVLATEQGRHVGGEAAQDDVGRVDDVPVTLDVAGLRGVRTHGRSLRFVSSMSSAQEPASDKSFGLRSTDVPVTERVGAQVTR
jgi:hypothetical protein